MPTVGPILRLSKLGRDGRAPVWIRISDTTGARYISSGVKVKPKDWHDAKAEVRRSHRDHQDLNALISAKVREAEQAFMAARLRGKTASLGDVKRAVRRPGATDFFTYAEQAVERMERKGQADSARRYRHVLLTKLKDFTGSPLPFDRIDVRLLREWETRLIEKGNAPSTVHSAFRALRAVYNKAEAEELADPTANPFRRFSLAPVPRAKKEKLTDTEMRALEDVDLGHGTPTWHARNAFVFAFYCAGMRFKDVCLLQHNHFHREGERWRLTYRTSKTSRDFAIVVPPAAVAIAEGYGLGEQDPAAYLFPFFQGRDVSTPLRLRKARDSRNALVNKHLKTVSKRAGVQKRISFHLARHSFADLARVRGTDLHTISKMLGHSSLRITEVYLKGFDQKAVDDAMDKMFETTHDRP